MKPEFDRLQTFIDGETAGASSLRVLEAGCGSCNHIDFRQKTHLVGIDISESQLEQNSYLDEKILGDIQYFDFPPSSFDIIVCVDVMEHLPEPEMALRGFARAVSPNGLIVLKMPNLLSVKGLLTKFLPHRMHQLVYKHLNKNEKGLEDSDIEPFKTYFRSSIAPNTLKKTASKIGLETVFFDTYDVSSTARLKRKKLTHRAYRIIRAFFKFISFNKLGSSEYILVLKKVSCTKTITRN